MKSRAKGCRGERDAAAAWSATFGVESRRGQQFAGGTDSPDIVTGHQSVHVEVKRTERGNPYVWLDQAVADAGEKVPVVLHRRNGREWILIVRLTDAPRLAEEITEKAQGVGGEQISSGLPRPGVHEGKAQDG